MNPIKRKYSLAEIVKKTQIATKSTRLSAASLHNDLLKSKHATIHTYKYTNQHTHTYTKCHGLKNTNLCRFVRLNTKKSVRLLIETWQIYQLQPDREY